MASMMLRSSHPLVMRRCSSTPQTLIMCLLPEHMLIRFRQLMARNVFSSSPPSHPTSLRCMRPNQLSDYPSLVGLLKAAHKFRDLSSIVT